MNPVTVPGACYTGRSMLQSPEVAIITAIEIAAALEVEAYAAMRKAFHRHGRVNTAITAREHDDAITKWHEAVMTRDKAEQRR